MYYMSINQIMLSQIILLMFYYGTISGHQITQSQVTTSAGSGNGATTITSSSQLANNQQQISPTGQQVVRLQNIMQSPGAVQAIQGLQGVNTATAVPGLQAAAAGVAISGAQNAAVPQQIITLPGGQQMAVRPAAVAAPQMIQIPQPQMVQQMMQVQVPVSQNGQTVLQTVQMPVQTMAAPAAPTYAQIPQIVQTSSGQQIVMQQVQIAQPQQAIQTPQFAQIITPTGQIQQVQVLGGIGNVAPAGQVIGGVQNLGGIQGVSIPQQLASVQSTGQNIQAHTISSGASTNANTVSSVSSSTTPAGSATNALLTPKSEPQDQPPDAEKPQNLNSPPGTIVQAGKPVQVMNVGNQQVVMQQAPGAVPVQPNQVVSVRTANGQIVQV